MAKGPVATAKSSGKFLNGWAESPGLVVKR